MRTTGKTPAQRINELIRCGAFGVDPDETPFLCECVEPRCHGVVWLGTDEFDALRDEGCDVIKAGHEAPPRVAEVVALNTFKPPDAEERLVG
jgi:hypothetical protein